MVQLCFWRPGCKWSKQADFWVTSQLACVRKQKEPEELALSPTLPPKSNQGPWKPLSTWAKLSPRMSWEVGPSLEMSAFHELLDPTAAESSNCLEREGAAKFLHSVLLTQPELVKAESSVCRRSNMLFYLRTKLLGKIFNADVNTAQASTVLKQARWSLRNLNHVV